MKKHRFGLFVLCVALLSCLLCVPTLAAEGDFVIENGILTGYAGTDANVTIPNSVKIIGKKAFMGNETIKSVTIPASVTEIEQSAFSFCENLTSVKLSEGIKKIGKEAFRNDNKLVSINFPEGLEEIGGAAFDQAPFTKAILPASIKVLGNGVFANCEKLTTATVPGGVKEMGGLFGGCTKLTNVTLGEGLTEIPRGMFSQCKNLSTIKLPSTVKSIGAGAFGSCTALRSITLPAGVTQIDEYAFGSCTSLVAITIPSGVTKLEVGLFEGCKKLAQVTLPVKLTEIGDRAFFDCVSLNSITIHADVTNIGQRAFFYYAKEPSYSYSGEPRRMLTIYGATGGAAQVHAEQYGYQFVSNGEVYVPTVGGFRDVPEAQYYAKPVLWAVEKGVTSGTSANTFSPDQTCTRAQIITFLWRAAGSPEVTHPGFGDVSEQDYYYKATCWAASVGIESGDTFKPNTNCTRAMAVEFIWRANGSPEAAQAEFRDVEREASYADAVDWALSRNVTSGTGEGTFSPNQTCTRAQIMTFLWKAFAQ